jgi:hypothetical protein
VDCGTGCKIFRQDILRDSRSEVVFDDADASAFGGAAFEDIDFTGRGL